MRNRFWLSVGMAGLLIGCGDDPQPIETPPPASLALYAEARGMPALEPRTPAKHYRLVGDLVFHLEDRERPQQGELWIGGAERMRFSIGEAAALPNVFLLANREQSWMQPPQQEFAEYDPTDLGIETLIRWHSLRFPWGWKKDEVGEFYLDTSSGRLSLEVNQAQLPSRVSLLGFHVALSQWEPSQRTKYLMPMHWDWTSESGRRVEDYASIHDQSLFLSSVFSPPKVNRDDHELLPATGIPAPQSDDFDFVVMDWQSSGIVAWTDSSSRKPGLWWEHLGERRFVFAPGVGLQPGAQHIASRDWLMWSTHQPISAQDAATHMLAALSALGAQADGALWSLIPEDLENTRRSFLLPVLRNH